MSNSFPLRWPAGWPRHSGEPKPSQFQTSFDGALKRLRDEIRLLGADPNSLIISSNVPLTSQGNPFAGGGRSRIGDAGVAIFFDLGGKPTVMARDAHDTVHANLMALAHSVGHMRGLARHGGDHMMRTAFSGFAALPAPGPPKTPWHEILHLLPSCRNPDLIEAAYRTLAKSAHPDAGGSADEMAKLSQARVDALETIKQARM